MDPFDLAFGEAVQEVTGVKPTEEPPKADPPKEEPPKEEPPKEEPPKADPPKEEPPKEEPPKEEPPKEEPPKEEPPKEEPPKADPLAAENARLKAELEKATQKPAAPTPEELAAEEARKQNQEKQAAEWEQFKKDWAEPAAMMEKMYTGILGQVQGMIQKAVTEAIAPLQTSVAQTAEERFISTINAGHQGGFDLIKSGKIDAWINTLPAYQRAGANKVMDEGSPQEVIELLDAYKASQTPETPPAVKTAEELAAEAKAEAEKKRKLTALGVVPDARTVVTGKADPQDYAGAFTQAVASGL